MKASWNTRISAVTVAALLAAVVIAAPTVVLAGKSYGEPLTGTDTIKISELIADSDRLVLSEGSATYGRAWRVNLRYDGSGALYRPPAGDDYLGFTKREAFDRLADRASVLEDAARVC